MNLEEILAKDGDLTDEEMVFVERELVKATRELHAMLKTIEREAAAADPRLAAKLRHVEKAAALPWANVTPGALAD